MSKAQELKPCPFCGSEAKMSHSRDGEVCNVRCAGWSVGNCLGAGPNCYSEAEAISGWNRRAPASSEQQAAQQDAQRWRTLINLPGASKRIWNHVLDDSVKSLGNGVAEVLDAARASNGGKA